MPADDCPSFHCRPSTASIVLPASVSTRQIPTTGTRDLGSEPAVSVEKSGLKGAAAIAGNNRVAMPIPAAMRNAFVLLFMMASLVNVRSVPGKRRLRHHANNQARQDREKP